MLKNDKESKKFRHSASFGKRIEHFMIGKMLKEGLDVYIPMIDDEGIDCVIKQGTGQYIEVQIKARSADVRFGSAGFFAGIRHEDIRENYFFVFYSERMDTTWIMSSEEFILEAVQNKNGKNVDKKAIWFNGKNTKTKSEYTRPQFEKYIAENFDRFKV